MYEHACRGQSKRTKLRLDCSPRSPRTLSYLVLCANTFWNGNVSLKRTASTRLARPPYVWPRMVCGSASYSGFDFLLRDCASK